MNYREFTEKLEKTNLSTYAQMSQNTKGRMQDEEKCLIRTDFQRDRDRIIHSKAFRRLKDKTQVYLGPESDHYRTRLTHTLEVSQVGRTIARGLRLNEDLVEAICLGHDLGHTPFGHEGERILDSICPHGFKHNEQSLRVVDILENDGKGLNLTWEVRDGIVNHSGSNTASTLEGQIVKFADRIAYINHDIDDSVRGKVISIDGLPKACIKVLGREHRQRISTMVMGILEESFGKPEVRMKAEILEAMNELRNYMFDNVYKIPVATKMEHAQSLTYIVSNLYEYYKKHIEKLPKELINKMKDYDDDKMVCDYIAGMSDNFAIETFKDLFFPKGWQ